MSKRYLLILFILTLSVITAVSGCFKKEIKPAPENNIKKPPIATTTKDADLTVWPEEKYTEEDYKGWKIYINEKLGYKIKYPADWTINACDEGCSSKEVIINPPDAEDFTSYISIGIDGRKIEDIRAIYTDSDRRLRSIDSNYKPATEEESIFANKKVFVFIRGVLGGREIIVLNKGTTYSISVGKDQNQQVRQALASFEFID